MRNPIKTTKWWLLHRLHPNHRYHVVRTGLPPGYYDPDIRILCATMEIVREFVDTAGPMIDWDSDEHHRQTWKDLQEVYYWWTKEYPEFEKADDRLHERWSRCLTEKCPFFPLEYKEGMEDTARDLLDRIDQLEERERRETKEMLIKVANNLPTLWYP